LVIFLLLNIILSGNIQTDHFEQDSVSTNDLIESYRQTGDTLWLNKALDAAKNNGENSYEGEALRQYGLYYSNYENAEKSIGYLLRAMKVFETAGDTVGLAKVNLNLGFLHYGLTETDLALEYTKNAVAYARQVDDPFMLSIILGNLGSMYERLDDGLEAALAAHHESLEISIRLSDSAGMFSTYNNLGVLYEKREQFEPALINYTRALNMAVALGETLEACRIQSNLASLNIRMGKYQAALKYLDASSEVCDAADMMLQLHRLDLRATALAGAGQYKAAYETQLRYFELNDSIFRVERMAAINELSQKYESEKKEQQISLLEKDVIIQKEVAKRETQRRHAILTVMVLVLLLAMVLVKLYFDKTKLNHQLEKLNNDLKDSELQLKALNRSKDKFFGILSHDLRNPLAAFEKLSTRISSLQPENQKELAVQMAGHSRLLLSLLNNVMIWSKSEQGLLTIKPQALIVHQLAAEALALYRLQAVEKGLALKNLTNPDILVFADRESLQTILRNLVNNAVKFTEHGEISITSTTKDEVAIIAVKDTGQGMSRQQVESIFQLATKQNAGLGLLLCKELAAKNNIEISIESEPGKGTAVLLKIPLFKPHDNSDS
jgi:signal transduction histidine kinase